MHHVNHDFAVLEIRRASEIRIGDRGLCRVTIESKVSAIRHGSLWISAKRLEGTTEEKRIEGRAAARHGCFPEIAAD